MHGLPLSPKVPGFSVNQVTELRKLLRGAKAEYKVVKNTLAARAAEGTILSGVKTYLKGTDRVGDRL